MTTELVTKNEWSQFTLSQLCSLITDGKHGDCQDQPHSGFYFLSVKDILSNRLVYENARQIKEKDFSETNRRTNLQPGDILFTNTGTIGRIAIAEDDPRTYRTTFQKSVAILKARRDLIEPDFLYYLLHFDNARLSEFAAGTTQKNLLLKDIRTFEVNVPPLPEQRAIAHILGTLDDKIELNRRMNQTLEEMARAIYKDWFVDFGPTRAKLAGREPYLPVEIWELFPDSLVDSEVGEIPEGWEVKPLGEICTFRAGSPFPKASQGSSSGTYPFAKVSDMNLPENSVSILGSANWVGEDDLSGLKAKLLPKGTTVFAKIGEALKHNRFRLVTIPTIVDNNMMGAIPDANLIEPLILFHALSGFDMGEIAGGTALPYLTINTLASLLIPIPPAKQQRVMGEPLKAFHEKSVANARESLQLSEKRESLLQKLVSGEIRVGS